MREQKQTSSQNQSQVIGQPILLATVEKIRALVTKKTPSNALRNYILWLLNDTNPYRDDYLQLTGIYKMSELSGYWLEGIYSDAIQHELANYLGALNAYFFFEVISDNLAIGLASPNNNDNQQQNERRTALKKFNDVMQQKLKGDTRPILELLSSISHLVNSISCFDQSLAATEARKLASEYTKQTDISINELEHATLSYLALNIASCLEAYELVADHPIATSILNSLISRYSAVNTLLDMEKTITITTLTQCGTKTILVVPTLLYIISAIDKIKPNPNLPNVINNGSLLMAVEKASCLIRLQNDIGTPLLISDSNSRNLLKQKMLGYCDKQAKIDMTGFNLIKKIAINAEFAPWLARIRKDLEYNEFNICLDRLRQNTQIDNTIQIFFDDIEYCSNLYHRLNHELASLLEDMTQQLNDTTASKLILKMVKFHEKLYAKEFEHSQGDYATKR